MVSLSLCHTLLGLLCWYVPCQAVDSAALQCTALSTVLVLWD